MLGVDWELVESVALGAGSCLVPSLELFLTRARLLDRDRPRPDVPNESLPRDVDLAFVVVGSVADDEDEYDDVDDGADEGDDDE